MNMLKTIKTHSLAAVALLMLCSPSSYANLKEKINVATNEALVVEFFNKIFNERADVEATANEYLSEDYIQHNPVVPTGREGFITAIGNWLPYVPNQVSEIKRVISAGDLVVLHVHYYDPTSENLGNAVVDIFRVDKQGKIVEHWDVIQAVPAVMAHENGMF